MSQTSDDSLFAGSEAKATEIIFKNLLNYKPLQCLQYCSQLAE